MNLEQIEARMAELDALVADTQDEEAVKNAIEERKQLEAEKAKLLAEEEEKKNQAAEAEKRAANAALLSGNPALGNVIGNRKGATTMQNVNEYRNSKEYINAFAEYIKTGEDKQVRALLTTNVGEAGTIAVPSLVYEEIKTAWDRNEIFEFVEKLDVVGNLLVNFEISASDAVFHDEGSGAVAEETLTEGIATLVPKSIIKWVSFSKEVLNMRGEDFLRYIYRELSHKILKAAADDLIGKIAALPSSANATTPCAVKIKKAAAVGTVVEAIGNLSDEAANPIIVMNKLSYAEFKKAAYAAGYGIDPFEGLPVRYNNSLPAYATATEDDVWMIVGDFGYGAIANFPNGQVANITVDELTKKKQGMIDVIGDQYVAAAPVACKAFCLVSKPASM